MLTRRLLGALFGVLAGLLTLTAPAAAHSDLTASDPVNGAELDAVPGTITLTFGEELQGSTAKVGVLVGDHDPVQLDAAVSGTTVTVNTSVDQLAEIVADGDGQWAISYQVVSADGHPVDGTLTFIVTQAGAEPASGASDANGSAAAEEASGSDDSRGSGGSADDAADASDESAAEDEPMPPLQWLATFALIGLVVFAVVKIDRMRRKKAQDAADKEAGRS